MRERVRHSRIRILFGVPLLALAACDRVTDDLCPARAEPQWNFETDFDRDTGLLRCERVPELCNRPVQSTLSEPNVARAIDIVFVSDGFRQNEMHDFHDRVGRIRAALIAEPRGIVGRDPTLFNFHEVEVASASDAVEERALRSCTSRDQKDFSVADMFRVVRAAANAPDADMIIVVARRWGYWREAVTGPSSGAPFIVTDFDTLPEVVNHEMGHILVGLGDEYVEYEGVSPIAATTQWTTSRQEPNLSLTKDETWDGLVSGAVEGGGLFAKGVYRPTDHCVMNNAFVDRDFCPVCNQAIDQMLAGRRGAADGAPRCGLWLGTGIAGVGGNGSALTVTAFGRDANGLASVTAMLDGAPFGGDTIVPDRLRKHPPLHHEFGTSVTAGQVLELTCTDATGAVATARLAAE